MEFWSDTNHNGLEAAQDRLAESGVTDGLPVIPPRVNA